VDKEFNTKNGIVFIFYNKNF